MLKTLNFFFVHLCVSGFASQFHDVFEEVFDPFFDLFVVFF